ncbi:MAG: IS1 family transposase [bacterium]
MNKLTDTRRAAIVRALCEGNSVRATARLTDTAKATVLKLLVELGEFCSIYQDVTLRNLKTVRVEADEIWSFVGAKAANATNESQGDIWTFTAMDADSKLMISWLVGPRTSEAAREFMGDLAPRLANRVQLTTDGLTHYTRAVEEAFGWNGCDYAQVRKEFGTTHEGPKGGRYSPSPVVLSSEKTVVFGKPDMSKASTSYIERSNLSIRMGNRRFTRLTNAFSKKAENHVHAVSLMFFFYNYCRPHMTLTKAANGLRTTPAMAAGISDHVWSVEEMLQLLDPERLLVSAR